MGVLKNMQSVYKLRLALGNAEMLCFLKKLSSFEDVKLLSTIRLVLFWIYIIFKAIVFAKGIRSWKF